MVALFAMLPDAYDNKVQATNFRYYEPRCGHGSSLSRGLHAMVSARLGDVALAERYFRETADIDLADTTTGSAGGIHIAALGGLWQAAIFGFAGLSCRDDGLAFEPHLPPAWTAMEFRVHWRGRRVHVRIEASSWLLSATLEHGQPLMIRSGDQAVELTPARTHQVSWRQAVGELGATWVANARRNDGGGRAPASWLMPSKGEHSAGRDSRHIMRKAIASTIAQIPLRKIWTGRTPTSAFAEILSGVGRLLSDSGGCGCGNGCAGDDGQARPENGDGAGSRPDVAGTGFRRPDL